MNNPRQDGKLPDESELKSFSHETEIYIVEKGIEPNIGPLSKDQGQLFRQLLTEFADLFANEKNGLGRTEIVTHRIYTENVPLIQSRPYSVPTNEQEFIKQEIQRMLENKLIQPSESPWTSPEFLLKRKIANYDSVLITENLTELLRKMHTRYRKLMKCWIPYQDPIGSLL